VRDRTADRVQVPTPSDARKLASAAEVLRRWWILVVVVAAMMGFAGGVLVGHGSLGARLDAMESRVTKMEGTAERVVRVEGMLEVIYRSQLGRLPRLDFPVVTP